MKVEDVLEVGEGPHFIHVYCVPGSGPISEVNLHHDQVESITIFEDTPQIAPPSLLDASGNPIGDEVQLAEQHPVTVEDAGSTPVVPAI